MNKLLLGLFIVPFVSFSQVSYTVTVTDLMAKADNCDGGTPPFCINAPQDPIFNIWTNDASANENTYCWIFEDDPEIEYSLWKDIQNVEIANVTNVMTSYINFDMAGYETDNLSPGCSPGVGDDAVYDRQFVQQYLLADIPEGTDFLATIDLQQVYYAKVIIHWIDLTAGSDELVNDLAFSISPNPSKGMFTVKLGNNSNKEVSLSVSDMSGRTVHQEKHQVGDIVNLESLESGTYVVTLSQGNNIAREQLIIQ